METIESEIVTTMTMTTKSNDTTDETIDDTEEGEILEDGEIADEDNNVFVVTVAATTVAVDKKQEIKHEQKDNKSNKDRDLRKREESTKRDRDKARDRDKDKTGKERIDRNERRHSYDRSGSDRDKKSAERDRKSSNEDEREKRRRERDRKRRRSEEEEEREKNRKRTRDNWESPSYDSNARTNYFGDYMRKANNNSEELDFRLKYNAYNKNPQPIHLNDDDEDMPFNDIDFDEMIGIMDNRVPLNRDALHSEEKRGLMRAMALMRAMTRSVDTEKSRATGRIVRQHKQRPERTPGPTGTRRTARQTDRVQPTPTFKAQCKFFIEGKCHKGADCSYSHDCLPLKKKEICKFYLQGFCGKGEECLYMHNEFPCKFFHTNVECYSGENCRFSHAPLNEETREILRNYLDSGQLPDDPKPDKNDTPKNEIKSTTNEIYSSSPSNSIGNSQQTATSSTSPATSSSTYAPMKPVAKRHAILGDPTNDMKASYYTWVWQQELKELEVAYVGNKRNLFCIEKQFVITDKPSTPRIEDDEDEIEAQIRSYYLDTMGTMGIEEEEDNNKMDNSSKTEEQKLIEASAHDEDLRTFFMAPHTSLNDSNDNLIIKKELLSDSDIKPKIDDLLISNASSHLKSDGSMNIPKIESDLKTGNKMNVKQEPKSWLSDSDDDDKDVLAAALKNIESKTVQSNSDTVYDKSMGSIDISKMLSAIRQSSNPSSSSAANNISKQTEFWQNILSGINLAGSSPSGNNTPPRHGYRDPRLKRGNDSSSPTPESTPILKICDPSVQIDYKLVPITINRIDYSCYVSIYRNDSRLKNDPRLSKFFSNLASSEIDNLSRIIPPPLKTAPVTPFSVLKASKKRSERKKKESHRKAKPNIHSSAALLPPLPPLTISPSKSAPTPGIIPPTPPPIMSPLELISSRPSFTVRESKTVNKIANDSNVIVKLEIKSALESESASSPEPVDRTNSDIINKIVKKETEIETNTTPMFVALNLNNNSLNAMTTNSQSLTPVDASAKCSSLSLQSSLKASDTERYTPPLTSNNLNIKKESEELNDQISNTKEDDLYDISFLSVNYDSINNGQQIGAHSPQSDENELQLICNELQSPIIDSDNEMEIDMTVNRKDSVSEVESSDECELTIASSSETEDNVNNDNESNNINSVSYNTILKPSNALLFDEPINLTVNDHIIDNTDNVEQSSDQSLKSVFSVIDPTASPFC